MLNPTIAWTPGTLVRYHGSITTLHDTYRAHPCTCLNCDDPVFGTARFRLTDGNDVTVLDCVRATSITETPEPGDRLITLTDGHRITTSNQSGTDLYDEVFLHPGLDADWDHPEDTAELFLSGDPELAKGRLFLDVPPADVRALIDEHGGAVEVDAETRQQQLA
ncbi:hypothetical protein [Streptomyces prasinopilosus]|uniref:hypothetical protein n=1 Tax=Streptomyces prasinopilosus TaxID=67344 RepID=UPI0006EBDFA9|nr:hypothetical protein [Streptomyces prasinopilosus]